MNRDRLKDVCAPRDSTIREALGYINKNHKGIVLVIDEVGRLIDAVTDGDIRRAHLDGVPMSCGISVLADRRKKGLYSKPVTAPVGTSSPKLLRTMTDLKIMQIPIVDDDLRVVDIVTLDELVNEQPLPTQAVVMAGGFGSRLMPLTEETPKPMLPVGDRPLLELIVEGLRDCGINTVNVTTHFKPEAIREHFGDGENFGVRMNYVNEDEPLGTAGALSLLGPQAGTTLVMNGDILTKVDFRAMLAYHREHAAEMTIGVRRHEVQIPYGVIEAKGPYVTEIREKPLLDFFINAGIYVLDPSALDRIPPGVRFDMTDLIRAVVADSGRIVRFPITEYWLDIGQHSDYEQALQDLKEGLLST